MLLLRREYRDGAEPPEIVLLHAEVTRHGGPAGPTRRFTRAVVPSETPGRRVAHLPLPEPAEGERILVRYRYSTVRGGEERFSPWYEVDVPSDDAIADLYHIPEEGTPNLPPAPGRGHFRLVLPLGGGGARIRALPVRLRRDAEKAVPVALPRRHRRGIRSGAGHRGPGGPLRPQEPADAVLPVPPLRGRETARRQDRVRPHHLRRSRRDRRLRPDGLGRFRMAGHEHLPHGGQGVWPRPRRCRPGHGWAGAADEFFAEDRAAFLAAREAALSLLPLPRVFEAFVFGPSGSAVEYCFQTVERRPDGELRGAVAEPGKRRELGRDPLEAAAAGPYRIAFSASRSAPTSSSVPTVMRRHSASRGVSKYRTRIFRRLSAS